MKVLITGATGRVGRQVVDLLGQQHDLLLLHRGITNGSAVVGGRIEQTAASLLDADAVTTALTDVDVVCHLAALMPPHENAAIFDTNVLGTFHVLEAIRTHGSRARIVYASSDAVYGTGWSQRTYPEPIQEDLTPQPTNFYGSSKVLCEQMLATYARLYGISYVALRFSWIFAGAEVLDLFSMGTWTEFMSEAQLARFQGVTAIPVLLEEDGTAFTEHVVDSRDCARAVELATSSREADGEAINICGPASFRYVDVSPRVGELLNLPLHELRLSSFHGYSFDTRKAEGFLNFRARYDIGTMLADGYAAQHPTDREM